MHSHQMRKYDISESTIQALYYDIVCNKVIIRACIMDSEMPYFLVWSLLSDIVLCILLLSSSHSGRHIYDYEKSHWTCYLCTCSNDIHCV